MSDPRRADGRLSNPVLAKRAWTRFRWMMRWVVVTAIVAVAAALLYLRAAGAPLNLVTVIATAAGVALSVLLAGALTALMFMSSGSGHDDDVAMFDTERSGDRWDRRE